MSYATLERLLKTHGESYLIDITDTEEPYQGQINQEKLKMALIKANGDVDMHLAKEYTVPLDNPSENLCLIACDLAVFYVINGSARRSDLDKEDYKIAIKKLQDIASNKLEIGTLKNFDSQGSKNLPQLRNGRDTVFSSNRY